MAMRRPKIGDVFEIALRENCKVYMQYVANDVTQMESEVIRVFSRRYASNEVVEVEDIVDDDVAFHAHTFVHLGAKEGRWTKIGNSQKLGKLDVLFRGSDDYGNPDVDVSEKWYVWKLGKTAKSIGKLKEKYQSLEYGYVIPAEFIIERIETGKYQFVHPGY